MARDSVIQKLVSSEALFHRFADFFRGLFLICFALLGALGLTGTAYFAAQVVLSDMPNAPAQTAVTRFSGPNVSEFETFSDRLLKGEILWPQAAIPIGAARAELTEKERKAIRQSEALERQKVWSNMTLQQQLNDLDSRLGKGVGAVKQRKRIQYAIDHPQVENQKKGKSKKSKKRNNVKNS